MIYIGIVILYCGILISTLIVPVSATILKSTDIHMMDLSFLRN